MLRRWLSARAPAALHHPGAPGLCRRARRRADPALRRRSARRWRAGWCCCPTTAPSGRCTDAFVRASGGGLLLPRLVAIGDPELDEAVGAALDPADDADPVPPAIAPLPAPDDPRAAGRARSARAPASRSMRPRRCGSPAIWRATLDQLLVEEVRRARLRELDLGEELSEHWQRALALFGIVLDRWPGELARLGRIDLAERRNRLLRRLARALAGCAARRASSAPRASPTPRRRSRGCCARSRNCRRAWSCCRISRPAMDERGMGGARPARARSRDRRVDARRSRRIRNSI